MTSGVLCLLSLPGSELVLPVIASRPAILAGNALRALMVSLGFGSGASVAVEPDNRQAFLRTLRSVVDFAVGGMRLNRLGFHGVLAGTDHQW